MTNKIEQTYILGDIEVKETGRTASKMLRKGNIMIVHEITPANIEDGSWKKWVNLSELYKVNSDKQRT